MAWVSHHLKQMKKLIWIAAALLGIGVLSYGFLRFQGYRSARPLVGVFDVRLKCMGGHEVFLELTGDAAYVNCPGHRERREGGKVIRDAKSATVIDHLCFS